MYMFRRLSQQLDTLMDKLERLDLILMIKEPETVKSADAYDGLRKRVIEAADNRRKHLADLAQIDAALHAGESPTELAMLLDDLCRRTGLQRAADTSIPELFDVVAGEGDRLEALSNAYIDELTGQIVRAGRARAHSDRESLGQDRPVVEVQA
jgi:hypothetical protein